MIFPLILYILSMCIYIYIYFLLFFSLFTVWIYPNHTELLRGLYIWVLWSPRDPSLYFRFPPRTLGSDPLRFLPPSFVFRFICLWKASKLSSAPVHWAAFTGSLAVSHPTFCKIRDSLRDDAMQRLFIFGNKQYSEKWTFKYSLAEEKFKGNF